MPWCAGRAVAPLEAHQAAKSRPVRGVGRPGRQRLLRVRVFRSPVAWVLSALQNPTPLIRALECVAILGPIGDNVGTMLTRQKPPPPRGSFDYLIEPVIRAPVPPPLPPEHGGRHPQRIRIEIEITDRRLPPRPQGRFGTITLILLLIAVLMALAGCTSTRAQPSSWQSYREGFMTMHQGTDAAGGSWTNSPPISTPTGRTGSSPAN